MLLGKYLFKRIRGKPTNSWCDVFDLDLLCHLVLNLGSLLRYGPEKFPTDLAPSERQHAMEAGFQAVAPNEAALTDALRVVRSASKSPKPGFYGDFGAVARWLVRVDYSDTRYSKLLDLIAEFAFENYPYGEGEKLFGRTCRVCKIHNLASAAKQHGLNYPKMTSLAVALGIGEEDRKERIEFEAARFDPVVSEYSKCLPPKKVAAQIGIKREALQRLAKAKLLKPRFDFTGMLPMYHPLDIENFVQTLAAKARSVAEIPEGHIGLIRLSQHAKCHFEQTIQYAVNGQLQSLCRRSDSVDICDFYADLEDLRDQLETAAHQGFMKREAKRMLRVNDPTMALLVQKSFLKATTVRHPRSRRPMALISADALKNFLSDFATLGMMAHAAKTQAKHVATKLEKAGFEPLPFGERFSKIYPRSPGLESLFHPGEIA
jgi:hypothetical protein